MTSTAISLEIIDLNKDNGDFPLTTNNHNGADDNDYLTMEKTAQKERSMQTEAFCYKYLQIVKT